MSLLKSMPPPVSQKLQHCQACVNPIPSADTGDCCDGVTVTSNELSDDPPTSTALTNTKPSASVPVKLLCENWTCTTIK